MQVVSSGVADVAAGGYHSMLRKHDGSVWATGCNNYGQLGDGSLSDRITYFPVSTGAESIAAGTRHSMMLKHDGSVWATGYNLYGQLGDGSVAISKVFVRVIPYGAKIVAAGGFHSMVYKGDGSIWATGSNRDGQFGDGSKNSALAFVKLSPFSNGLFTREHGVPAFVCPFSACICVPFYAFAGHHIHSDPS